MSRKSEILESTLMKAETNQLESFIRSRSQFLDLEIERMRNKLHQTPTKASTSIGDSSHDESRRHSSDSRGQHSDKKLDNSRTVDSMGQRPSDRPSKDRSHRSEVHSNSELLNRSEESYMTGQRNSNEVHMSPTGRNLTARGQGIQLVSKDRILPNRNYSPNRRPDTMDANSLSNIRNQNNNQNNRGSTNHSAFQKGKNVPGYASRDKKYIQTGHRNEIARRGDQIDHSDDSDLSDNPSQNRNRNRSSSNNGRSEKEVVSEREVQGEVQGGVEIKNNLKNKDRDNYKNIQALVLAKTTPNNNTNHRSKSLSNTCENNEKNNHNRISRKSDTSHQFLADVSPNMKNLLERINQGKIIAYILLRNVRIYAELLVVCCLLFFYHILIIFSF